MTDDCNNHGRETVRRINTSNSSCNRVMPSSSTDTEVTTLVEYNSTTHSENISTMKQISRQAADGMDSEALHKQDMSPNISNSSARHTNLTASAKSATIAKVQSRQYVPHEPVRGAVKYVDPKALSSEASTETSIDMQWNVTPIRAQRESHTVNMRSPVEMSKYGTSTPIKSTKTAPSAERRLTVKEMVGTDVRQVEGTVSRHRTQRELTSKLVDLEKALENQTKVNEDLKRMLIASVGSDLHDKVENLVKDRATLSEEVGHFNRRATQDDEDKDKLYIQADMWRTKYKASKLLHSQMKEQQSKQTSQICSHQNAIQGLLHERGELRHTAALTYRYLKLMHEAFDTQRSNSYTVDTQSDLLQLNSLNAQLGEIIKHRLIGTVAPPIGAVDLLAGASWTPAEIYAQQVMRGDPSLQPVESLRTSTKADYHGRFHPTTSYENITINCCRKCKGEIQIV